MNCKLIIVAAAAAIGANAQPLTMLDKTIEQVPFTDVHFTDRFWLPKMETNRTVSIPSAFRECEKNGRFDNFAIAGGLKQGEHRGDFSFDDTDPYKVIEGASYSLAVKYDARLDHYLDSVIGLIAAAQEDDGYLTTCVTNKCYRLSGWWGRSKWEKINSHELYNSGHLYEAAVAHYQATGKRTLLDVALKNADLVCKTFGPNEGQIHRPGGHPIVEMALCKLYKVTGNKKYLEQARYFVDETGRCTDGHHPSEYSQDHKPILQQTEIVGHAVRAGYLFSGVADVTALQHDTAYFRAICRIWQNMADKKLYITGGIGSRAQGEGFGPEYELNSQTAYAETCASISNVYWNERMFLLTGDARFIDVLERALYNGCISGVSLSGDHFFYDNPLGSIGQHNRERWFGCACCPGNVTRFVASVPWYMYGVSGNDLYVNLYAQSESNIKQLGITVNQTTDYPWEGNVKLTIGSQKGGKSTKLKNLRLRIPGWACKKPVEGCTLYAFADKAPEVTVKVNGQTVPVKLYKGYLVINRKWKSGDQVEIAMPMTVRRIVANDQVHDCEGKTAYQRGPIVYCLEGKDQKDGHVFNKLIQPSGEITAHYEPSLLKGVEVLEGKAKTFETNGDTDETTFRAIPYYAWDNRMNDTGYMGDEMTVWTASSLKAIHTTPEPTLASRSRSLVLKAPIQKDAPVSSSTEEYAWGVNDQWEPENSHDTAKPYFYWWLRVGVPVTLAYSLPEETEISESSIYWMQMDHYDGSFDIPESYKLQYLNADDQWQDVEPLNSYVVEADKWNTVCFKPVKTTKIQIAAQLKQGLSGGVLEWKIK